MVIDYALNFYFTQVTPPDFFIALFSAVFLLTILFIFYKLGT